MGAWIVGNMWWLDPIYWGGASVMYAACVMRKVWAAWCPAKAKVTCKGDMDILVLHAT